MKRKKIYLYAGYYEMFITDVPMQKPYCLISWHYSVERAEMSAEKEHPGDVCHYKENLCPDYLYDSLSWDGALNIQKIQGEPFVIL